MRPDKYKQAQARKYQAKLRSRGSEASKEIQEKRKERNLKSRGGFQNKSGNKEHETEEIGEENGNKKFTFIFFVVKLYHNNFLFPDNSYRYKDISDTEGNNIYNIYNTLITRVKQFYLLFDLEAIDGIDSETDDSGKLLNFSFEFLIS